MPAEQDELGRRQTEAMEMLNERRTALAEVFSSGPLVRDQLKRWQLETSLALEKGISKSASQLFIQFPFPDQNSMSWRIQAKLYADSQGQYLNDLALEIEMMPERHFQIKAAIEPPSDSHATGLSAKSKRALSMFEERISKAQEISNGNFNVDQMKTRADRWRSDTESGLRRYVKEDESEKFLLLSINGGWYDDVINPAGYLMWAIGYLETLADSVRDSPENYFEPSANKPASEAPTTAGVVYIMHGSDMTNAFMLKDMLIKMKIEARFLSEDASGSKTLREMLDDSKSRACFVLVLLTPDDVIRIRRWRTQRQPRPNVLIELGYYLGHLGKDRVVMVCQRDVHDAMPSDLKGIRVAMFDRQVKEAMGEIQNELKQAGLYGGS